MKTNFISIFLFLLSVIPIQSQKYNDFFLNKACRIDFQLCGNRDNTRAYLANIKEEPFWGGRRSKLSEDLNLGQYRFQVLDSATNELLYLNGFSTLYFEWQSTEEAKIINKCFEQSIQFPYPQKTVVINIEKRLDFDAWESILSFTLNPKDKLIKKTALKKTAVKEIQIKDTPDKAIDIALIAEGYTAEELDKFFGDAEKIAGHLLSHKPFSEYKNRINIYAVGAISEESGISMPHKNDWKNTALGSHYYTFYSERYLTSTNIFNMHDIAANVPYDAILILANTENYGGGGIYNFYAVASADSKRAQREVVVHEFGHSFAGLGDEYFYETDALDGMYDITQEPWEPNITSLVKFDRKWKKDLDPTTAIPTPLNEETKKLDIGVFEGAGYLSKGMYRPAYDCRMRTNDAESFCPVCEKAVERVILFLTGEKHKL